MRLWSLHPRYLDTKGLLAAWREGLLAKAVLEGKTKGYKKHPQLLRFTQSRDPIGAINTYLCAIANEAKIRSFTFDTTKIHACGIDEPLTVTKGQLAYEWKHLLKKLKTRDPERYQQLKKVKEILPHPSFREVEGAIADWEIVTD